MFRWNAKTPTKTKLRNVVEKVLLIVKKHKLLNFHVKMAITYTECVTCTIHNSIYTS
jgi:hypothetical protein